jgi:hypothetical protein
LLELADFPCLIGDNLLGVVVVAVFQPKTEAAFVRLRNRKNPPRDVSA